MLYSFLLHSFPGSSTSVVSLVSVSCLCYNLLTVSIPSFCLPPQYIYYFTFPFSQSFFFWYPPSPSSFPSFPGLLLNFLVALSFLCITLSSVSFRYFFLLNLLCIGLFSGCHLTYYVSFCNHCPWNNLSNLPYNVHICELIIFCLFLSFLSFAYTIYVFHTAFCSELPPPPPSHPPPFPPSYFATFIWVLWKRCRY